MEIPRAQVSKQYWTDEQLNQVMSMKAEGLSWPAIASRMGVTSDSVRKAYARNIELTRAKANQVSPFPVIPEVDPSKMVPGVEKVDPDHEVATMVAGKPITEAQMVKAFKIDLTRWNPVRLIPNCWDGKEARPSNRIIRYYGARLFLVKRPGVADSDIILDHLRSSISKLSKPFPKVKYSRRPGPQLLEIDLFDAHLEKLAWAEVSGEDCSLETTCAFYRESLEAVIDRCRGFNIGRILFPIGNDFWTSDDCRNQTTFGTPQDTSTVWQMAYRAGQNLLIESIERLRQIAPVDVIVVPGNHDRQRTFFVGEALRLVYGKTAGVTVDSRSCARKYYEFGKTLLGFSHGNLEKVTSLPVIMAQEAREAWGRTYYHEWHLGHFHHRKEIQYVSADDHTGVVIRFLQPISGTDEWHYSRGYIGGRRGAQGFVWDQESGLTAQIQSPGAPATAKNPLPPVNGSISG